jgi:hypothetical protein
VSFAGEVTWLSGDGRVRLLADSILNERAGGRSGPLRLRLWATSTPWHGETILQGYPLGRARLPRLRAGTAIALDRTTFFYPPPPGEYSVTLTLEEWVRGRWEIRDWITYPDRNLF